MFILSIDVGVKNLALYMEHFDKDGVCEMKEVDQVCRSGRCVLFARLDLYKEGECNCKIPEVVIDRLVSFFDHNRSIIGLCSGVVIEEQLYAKNPIAPQIAAMIRTYFTIRYPNIEVALMSPKDKTKLLGVDRKLKGKQLKEWTVSTAIKYLNERNDRAVDFLCSKRAGDGKTIYQDGKMVFCSLAGDRKGRGKKNDDYGDAFCQLQAFKLSCFVTRSFQG